MTYGWAMTVSFVDHLPDCNMAESTTPEESEVGSGQHLVAAIREDDEVNGYFNQNNAWC